MMTSRTHDLDDCFQRVVLWEKESRGNDTSRSGLSEDVRAILSQDVLSQDSFSRFSLMSSLYGLTELAPAAVNRLLGDACYGILLQAGAEGFLGDDRAWMSVLLARGSTRDRMRERLQFYCQNPPRPGTWRFPSDQYGHGPLWYVRLFRALRPELASHYDDVAQILRQFGCPQPETRDSLGLTLADWLEGLSPKKADYLAIDISVPPAEGQHYPITYLSRAEGERLAHDANQNDRLLFRYVKGTRTRRMKSYLSVFPLTQGQYRRLTLCDRTALEDDDLPCAFTFSDLTVKIPDLINRLVRQTGFPRLGLPDAGLGHYVNTSAEVRRFFNMTGSVCEYCESDGKFSGGYLRNSPVGSILLRTIQTVLRRNREENRRFGFRLAIPL